MTEGGGKRRRTGNDRKKALKFGLLFFSQSPTFFCCSFGQSNSAPKSNQNPSILATSALGRSLRYFEKPIFFFFFSFFFWGFSFFLVVGSFVCFFLVWVLGGKKEGEIMGSFCSLSFFLFFCSFVLLSQTNSVREASSSPQETNLLLKIQKERGDVVMPYNDPLFPAQWHLWNREVGEADINVLPVWGRGYFGNTSTIAVCGYHFLFLLSIFFFEKSRIEIEREILEEREILSHFFKKKYSNSSSSLSFLLSSTKKIHFFSYQFSKKKKQVSISKRTS